MKKNRCCLGRGGRVIRICCSTQIFFMQQAVCFCFTGSNLRKNCTTCSQRRFEALSMHQHNHPTLSGHNKLQPMEKSNGAFAEIIVPMQRLQAYCTWMALHYRTEQFTDLDYCDDALALLCTDRTHPAGSILSFSSREKSSRGMLRLTVRLHETVFSQRVICQNNNSTIIVDTLV